MPHRHAPARTPAISENMWLTFKLGTLISIGTGLVVGTWWVSTEWNALQNRLNALERAQAWQTSAIHEYVHKTASK